MLALSPLILSIVFLCNSFFITILVSQAARLGVRCPYPVRLAQPTVRLAASNGQSGVFLFSGLPICLVWVMSIRVSFSQGQSPPLLHHSVGTQELGFGGAFVVRICQSIWLDLGYIVSHFRIQGLNADPVWNCRYPVFGYDTTFSYRKGPVNDCLFSRFGTEWFLSLSSTKEITLRTSVHHWSIRSSPKNHLSFSKRACTVLSNMILSVWITRKIQLKNRYSQNIHVGMFFRLVDFRYLWNCTYFFRQPSQLHSGKCICGTGTN